MIEIRREGIEMKRWGLGLILMVGFAAMAMALEKVQPTPGAIILCNFDSKSGELFVYDDRGAGRNSIAALAPTHDAIEGDRAIAFTFKLDGWCGFGIAREMEPKLKWDWEGYAAFSFWMKGQNSGATLGVDLEDKNRERFSIQHIVDDSTEWKHIVVPLDEMDLRPDYQEVEKVDHVMDFPMRAFAVYPMSGSATIIFDNFEIIPKK